VADSLELGVQALLTIGFQKVDYLELRHAQSLAPMTEYASPARLLVAAWLGKTRLLDNISL
jgi:pantoate--beta-alanine ligase